MERGPRFGCNPSGAGGFSVDVPGASNPTVTAIAVVGNVVTLSLNTPIALGTAGCDGELPPDLDAVARYGGERGNGICERTCRDGCRGRNRARADCGGGGRAPAHPHPQRAAQGDQSGGQRRGPGLSRLATVGVGSVLFTVVGRIRAGVGPGNTRVTMTLNPPAPGRTDARGAVFGRDRHRGVQGSGSRRERGCWIHSR